MRFGDGHEIRVFLFLKVKNVTLADETVTDEANANPFVSAEHAFPAGGTDKGRGASLHESAPANHGLS
jgi:hypothetical protein